VRLLRWLFIGLISSLSSNDGFQFSGVTQGILDDLPAGAEYVLLRGVEILLLPGEPYPTVLDRPPPLPGKLDDGALGIEEEEVFGIAYGDRPVRFLRARSNLGSNRSNQNLNVE
jgi:hypothetical protein